MKYMGHKGRLLPILGDILIHESAGADQIADPFCGSGAVSWFLATKLSKRLIAGDLQSFAVVRAAAVLGRTSPIKGMELVQAWIARSRIIVELVLSAFYRQGIKIDSEQKFQQLGNDVVHDSRRICEGQAPSALRALEGIFPITLAYGGHYFSPMQAICLDALRQTLPIEAQERNVALAALIEVASKCSASPGHTAQPFQPTESAGKHILEAWDRDVFGLLEIAVKNISVLYAKRTGVAKTQDYVDSIKTLNPGDLVFADPPYSAVHYSRFYHVLETVARGQLFDPFGRGRYPSLHMRPSSCFSQKKEAGGAARHLIDACVRRQVSLVLTFPSVGASNGLTAADFVSIGANRFSSIKIYRAQSLFSTLGGNSRKRAGKVRYEESIICFRA